jgi:hypothetical protein
MEFGGALTCMHAYRWFIEIVLPEIEKIEKRDLTVTLSICDMPRRDHAAENYNAGVDRQYETRYFGSFYFFG